MGKSWLRFFIQNDWKVTKSWRVRISRIFFNEYFEGTGEFLDGVLGWIILEWRLEEVCFGLANQHRVKSVRQMSSKTHQKNFPTLFLSMYIFQIIYFRQGIINLFPPQRCLIYFRTKHLKIFRKFRIFNTKPDLSPVFFCHENVKNRRMYCIIFLGIFLSYENQNRESEIFSRDFYDKQFGERPKT